MSNFSFLKAEWPEIQASAARGETLALTDPRGACFYARRTLELAVHWIYARDPALGVADDDNLGALLHDPEFRQVVPQDVFLKARVVKELGNEAVHSRRAIEAADATRAIRELFHLLYWLARTYTRQGAALYGGLTFDPEALSAGAKRAVAQKASTAAQLQQLQAEIAERDRQLREQQEARLQTEKTAAELDAEIRQLKAEIAAAKKQNEAVPDDHDYSEAETRDYFIDLLLREAGWPLDKKEDREYPVHGMPNKRGEGFVDYVLWGDDGLPLGLVEAKRTKRDPRVGQQQAKLYGDCLEQQFGRRPVLFYTNGYETWLWDDVNYPPRPVQGFYKKAELELLIRRRASRKPLAGATIDTAIVERPYQIEAIRRVTEALEKSQRKALVVMATGAGKTRTVIALCDLLQRCNWIKRVLFLADRVALVNQAANAFKTHLPASSPVNLVTEKEDTGSRVLLSTYPTMMGLIDQINGDERRFGPGHFDLVVIDEAHRSVYQKYGAIFSYFDSLLVGLTATPKAEVDKNTYRLFDLQNGEPTAAFELDEAVAGGWLVPPRPVSVPLKFQREGIRYDDLSDEEKEEWESVEWNEEGEVPDHIDAAAVNKWLFNEDTVDKVLEHLMTRGQKVEGNDRLGKTIIFAKNHAHAVFIQERFDKNYPHLKGSFARVIDNYEPYAQSLIDAFSDRDKPPHVAISVDMLDTGIDVPEVVNLVFFKIVRSKTKFWQMIGRGTRLCKGLLGPARDKEYFYLFDYCQNLEFFGHNAKGVEGNLQDSLSKKLFLRRLELLEDVRRVPAGGCGEPPAEIAAIGTEIADQLHTEVAAMNLDNFIVRPERRYVEQYREREAWDELRSGEAAEIGEHLAGLPTELDPDDITARQFDLLLLNLQLALLRNEPGMYRLREQVVEIATLLEEKENIPLVAAQMELILDIQTDEFWDHVTLPQLENVRKRLRDLVKFIERARRNPVYTAFEDAIGDGAEVTFAELGSSIEVAQYRRKVTKFLETRRDDAVIRKLRLNETLTPEDLLALERLLYELGGEGSREQFERAFGRPESLGAFIRGLVGLDRGAVQRAFARHLADTRYTASQIRFIHQIIDHLTKNGVMDPGLLFEQPFTNDNPYGLEGLFPEPAAIDIVNILARVNGNAGWMGSGGPSV
jgi:type I restriction enzyme R subunit